ncbi:Predicted oxidoreductase [Cryobacterium psychrotolerans]|uniref:Predicted oxidoreductase n=1 Tax=Cryobacterium psychrotolerans TaxID=386301 RepID=A0A1G9H684_9MICO|nr:aldo/keto reductase [Cryobacterium psychrotolerans]TFD83473.1 aldo/keto reductase [Cryobacterium psychrotolerans]SDL08496.1 Predicted oxidoreductase [Cryobacterium psychrotolerans]
MHGTHVAGLDLPISHVALGTMTFGDTVDAATAASLIDAALDAGITVIDTANVYAGGASEEILASLLPKRRDSVLLASKAGMPNPDAGEHSPLSDAGLRRSVSGSLRRLGVERIDLFYLHQPDRATPLEETMGAVAELVRQGTIGALGVSNFAAWQISELNYVADAIGTPRPVVAQQLFNLVARRIEEEYLEFAGATGLLTMVYNPLGGGLLTGSHRFAELPTEGRFGSSKLAEMYKQRYWDPRLFTAIDSLAKIAAGAGITLIELSLRWLMNRPDVGAILLGASRLEQLHSNILAAEKGPLAADVIAACDDVGLTLRGPMANYNR